MKDLADIVDITDHHDPHNDGGWDMLDGVLRGSTTMAISHHGTDLKDILERLSKECKKVKRYASNQSCIICLLMRPKE